MNERDRKPVNPNNFEQPDRADHPLSAGMDRTVAFCKFCGPGSGHTSEWCPASGKGAGGNNEQTRAFCRVCGPDANHSNEQCPVANNQSAGIFLPDPVLNETYEFVEVIGSGGMGAIYKARHRRLNKLYAIKVMHSKLKSEVAVRRFYIEGKAASMLDHPGIVKVHDLNLSQSGQPYMVMDLVHGSNLGDILKQEGSLTIRRFLAIFIEACSIFAHAHGRGVLHRDIKPNNIMLEKDEAGNEHVLVLDFGIAKVLDDTGYNAQQLTETGDAVGSPLYMSPEQGRGQKTDQSADIYSLGCSMYEALTGAPPFIGKSALDTMIKHFTEMPMSMTQSSAGKEIPQELQDIVLRTLAKAPEDRQASMTDLGNELRSFEKHMNAPRAMNRVKLSQGARPVSQVKQSSKPWKIVIPAVVVFGLIVAGVLVSMLAHPAKPPVAVMLPNGAHPPAQQVAANSTNAQSDSGDLTHLTDSIAQSAPKYFPHEGSTIDPKEQLAVMIKSNIAQGRKNWDLRHVAMFSVLEDKDVAFLQTLKPDQAHTLDLTYSKVDDQALEYIKNLKLVSLSAGYTRVKDLQALKNIHTLKNLDLDGTHISEEGLNTICHLPNLEKLYLKGVTIRASDLSKLAALKNLKKLFLVGCKLKYDEVMAIQKALPACDVIFSGADHEKLKRFVPEVDEAITAASKQNFAKADALLSQGLIEFRAAGWPNADVERGVLELKGNDEMGMKDYGRALASFSEALQLCKNYSAYRLDINHLMNSQALACEGLGKYEKAAAVRRQLQNREELSTKALTDGEYEPADRQTDLQRTIIFFARNRTFLGKDLLRGKGDYEAAKAVLDDANASFEKVDEKADQALCQKLLGDAWLQQSTDRTEVGVGMRGEYLDDSIHCYERALPFLSEEDASDANFGLARACAATGQKERAKGILKKLLQENSLPAVHEKQLKLLQSLGEGSK